MKTSRHRQILTSVAICAGCTFQATAAPRPTVRAMRSVGFEPNQGQAAPEVRFIQHAAGYTVLALDHGLDLRLPPPQGSSFRMEFAGAGSASRVSSQNLLPGRVNYLKGSNPLAWQRNIPTFARIQYNDLYPGVAASFYTNGGQLEYDIAVQPHSALSAVKLKFSSGAARVQPTVARNGDLLCRLSGGEIRLHKPVVYQVSAAHGKQFLPGHFVLRTPTEVGFSVPAYDHTRPLIIDPIVTYSTYLGGGDDEGIFAIKQDATGNLYVAGETSSINFQPHLPFRVHMAAASTMASFRSSTLQAAS